MVPTSLVTLVYEHSLAQKIKVPAMRYRDLMKHAMLLATAQMAAY